MRIPRWIVAIAVLTFVAATPTLPMAMKHIVNQSGLTFSPNALSIVEGDTVQWVWSSGGHTVTNGGGASDPSAGTLFDAPLNSPNPTFEYVFTTAGTYPYFCRPHETFGMTGTITVDVAIGALTPVATTIWLGQSYPNPFNPRTTIAFRLTEPGNVRLDVFDSQGRHVRELANGPLGSGVREVVWDGKEEYGVQSASGVYFYRLKVGTQILTKKMVLLK